MFEYNEEKAMADDNKKFAPGAWDVEISQAYLERQDSGAECLSVTLVADSKKIRKKIFYKNKDGSENFNVSMIHQMMKILDIKKTTKIKSKIKIWDDASKKEIDADGVAIAEFHSKKIGILLDMSDSENGKKYLNVIKFYDVKTKKTASEMIENKEASFVFDFIKKTNNKKHENLEQKNKTVEEDLLDEIPF